MRLSSYFWRFVHQDLLRHLNDLETERDEWKHEAEKQIKLARGANAILEQHIRALMKERDELRKAAGDPCNESWNAHC